MTYDDTAGPTHALVIDLLTDVYAVTSPAMVRPTVSDLGSNMARRLPGRQDGYAVAGMVYANLISWAFGTATDRCGCNHPDCRGATTVFRVLSSDTPDGEPKVSNVDDAPPLVRAVGRFITAACNGDTSTVQAVWSSVIAPEGREDLGPFVASIVHTAVTIAEKRLTTTTVGSGRP